MYIEGVTHGTGSVVGSVCKVEASLDFISNSLPALLPGPSPACPILSVCRAYSYSAGKSSLISHVLISASAEVHGPRPCST